LLSEKAKLKGDGKNIRHCTVSILTRKGWSRISWRSTGNM
jgi:hypothetical protein